MRDAHTCPSRWGLREGAARRKEGAGQGRGRDVPDRSRPRLRGHAPAPRPAGIRDSRVCGVRCWHAHLIRTGPPAIHQRCLQSATLGGGRTETGGVPPPPPQIPLLTQNCWVLRLQVHSTWGKVCSEGRGWPVIPPEYFLHFLPHSRYYLLTLPPAKGCEWMAKKGDSSPWVSGEITWHLTAIVRNCFHLLCMIRACLYLAKFSVENSSKMVAKIKSTKRFTSPSPLKRCWPLGFRISFWKSILRKSFRHTCPLWCSLLWWTWNTRVRWRAQTHPIEYYATI